MYHDHSGMVYGVKNVPSGSLPRIQPPQKSQYGSITEDPYAVKRVQPTRYSTEYDLQIVELWM